MWNLVFASTVANASLLATIMVIRQSLSTLSRTFQRLLRKSVLVAESAKVFALPLIASAFTRAMVLSHLFEIKKTYKCFNKSFGYNDLI